MIFRFIIDGIITLPIALYGFLVFPDLPRTTKSFYLSEEVGAFTEQNICFILAYFVMFPESQERVLAYERLEEVSVLEQAKSRPLSWNLLRRVLGGWRWYACSLLVSLILFCTIRRLFILLNSSQFLERRKVLVLIILWANG